MKNVSVKSTEINFHSEGISFLLKNKTRLRSWIKDVLREEKKTPGRINFIFCNDSYLHKLNTDYLQHDTLTDIITFDYSQLKNEDISPGNNIVSGDIFISIERVKENASKFETTFENELHRVMIHGILHLSGYSDKTSPAKQLMTQKEDFYLYLLT